jgi:hypothetical protein
MRTYFARLWAALWGRPLPTETGGPVIQGGGGPVDPGKPR